MAADGRVVQRACQSADTSVTSQRSGIFPDAAGEPEQSGDLRLGAQNTHETFAR